MLNQSLRLLYAGLMLCAVSALGAETIQVTIEGELLDLRCYTARESHGAEHEACAARCLSNGAPAAVLTKDGKVTVLAASGKTYSRFAADQVRLEGTMRNDVLLPESMQVFLDGKWIDVPLTYGAPAEKTEE